MRALMPKHGRLMHQPENLFMTQACKYHS